jgi:D-alanine transaminase
VTTARAAASWRTPIPAAEHAESLDKAAAFLRHRGRAVGPDAPFGAVSRTPTIAVLAAPAPAPRATMTVTLVAGGRRPAAIKSTSWAWSAQAIATARAAGADTAILHEDGVVLEAAAANVVIHLDGRLVTPVADGRLLPGTARAVLLEVADLREEVVRLSDLERADEVVLTSAVRGAVPVVAIDDRAVAGGTPGPAADHLRALLRAEGVGPLDR